MAYKILKSEKINIKCFGGAYDREIYDTFTSRHPKFPLLCLKTFGVAIQPVTQTFEGKRFEMLRRKVRRAEKLGYTIQEIDPEKRIEEILDVNTSVNFRQGKAVQDRYKNREKVREYNKNPGPWFGVIDKDEGLKAYCHAPIFGEAYCYSRIFGHAGYLEDGIMYLMIRETMAFMSKRLDNEGFPRWATYDMYLGALDGLREFKKRSGFDPAWVHWEWEDR
jgi:hypothetical protein